MTKDCISRSWTPIAEPKEVVLDALGVSPTTKMTSSSTSSSGCSPRAWRHGGRLLLNTRESLARLLFAEGRTSKRTGTKNSATTCRNRQVSPVCFRTVSSDALISSICRKPPRYVLYRCTYVPYDGTFGVSDQGQTLDVWQGEDSQIHHLIQQICRFTITSVRKKSNQKGYRRIRFSTTILDHMDRN